MLLYSYFVRCNVAFLFCLFLLYDVLVLRYMYFTSLSLRVAARVIAFPSHLSCTRLAAAPSVTANAFCPAASLEILFVCYSLLAITTRSAASAAFRRLPSTSLGGGEFGWYLLVLATVPRCRAPHIFIDAKSPIYILLLNIFSPQVPRVTLVFSHSHK